MQKQIMQIEKKILEKEELEQSIKLDQGPNAL